MGMKGGKRMEVGFMIVRNLVWTLLPFFFGWVIYQLKESKIVMDRVAFLVEKADEIVEWIEEEYPELPYIDKVNRVIDILIEELEEAGYKVGDREEIERVVKAAFHRYKIKTRGQKFD